MVIPFAAIARSTDERPLKLHFTDDVYNWLMSTASASGISVSDVVEALIRHYIETTRPKQ